MSSHLVNITERKVITALVVVVCAPLYFGCKSPSISVLPNAENDFGRITVSTPLFVPLEDPAAGDRRLKFGDLNTESNIAANLRMPTAAYRSMDAVTTAAQLVLQYSEVQTQNASNSPVSQNLVNQLGQALTNMIPSLPATYALSPADVATLVAAYRTYMVNLEEYLNFDGFGYEDGEASDYLPYKMHFTVTSDPNWALSHAGLDPVVDVTLLTGADGRDYRVLTVLPLETHQTSTELSSTLTSALREIALGASYKKVNLSAALQKLSALVTQEERLRADKTMTVSVPESNTISIVFRSPQSPLGEPVPPLPATRILTVIVLAKRSVVSGESSNHLAQPNIQSNLKAGEKVTNAECRVEVRPWFRRNRAPLDDSGSGDASNRLARNWVPRATVTTRTCQVPIWYGPLRKGTLAVSSAEGTYWPLFRNDTFYAEATNKLNALNGQISALSQLSGISRMNLEALKQTHSHLAAQAAQNASASDVISKNLRAGTPEVEKITIAMLNYSKAMAGVATNLAEFITANQSKISDKSDSGVLRDVKAQLDTFSGQLGQFAEIHTNLQMLAAHFTNTATRIESAKQGNPPIPEWPDKQQQALEKTMTELDGTVAVLKDLLPDVRKKLDLLRTSLLASVEGIGTVSFTIKAPEKQKNDTRILSDVAVFGRLRGVRNEEKQNEQFTWLGHGNVAGTLTAGQIDLGAPAGAADIVFNMPIKIWLEVALASSEIEKHGTGTNGMFALSPKEIIQSVVKEVNLLPRLGTNQVPYLTRATITNSPTAGGAKN
ncbi:MAG TPA: hypothetical protein VMF06_20000 [Candidatus Limnocylindria bacterium]|jgi:hypothetical protein|nr:hypothetical protein [Candidatus Limnocylindria bacterium]